ncbi:hypothetical protein AaE_013663, partial [Aphanomyces astaci]
MSVQQTAVDRKIHASPTSTGRSFVGNTSHYAVCLWLSLWFALNMTVTIVNKQALTVLNLPVTLTCVHMTCNSIGAYVYVHLSCRGGARGRPLPLRPDQAITMFFFSFIFVSNIILGNWSLGLVSVSLNQIMRALVPGTTAVLSTVVLHTTYTMSQILALAPIALGVYVACSRDIASTPVGIAITALAILFASLKSVLSSKFLTGHVTVTPVQLILHQAPLSAVWCAVVMILGGEWDVLQSTPWDVVRPAVGLYVVTGAFSFALNVTSFAANRCTSAVTLAVCANVKQVAVVALSVVIHGDDVVSGQMLWGCALVVAGGV